MTTDTQRTIEATLAKIDAAIGQARAVCLTGLDASTHTEVYAAMVALNDARGAILRAAIAAK